MPRFTFAAACLLLLTTLAAAAPAQAADLDQAHALFQEGRFAEAAKAFSQGGSAEALVWEATAWNQAGEGGKAEKAARRAIGLSDDPAVLGPAWNAVGVALSAGTQKEKKLQEAADAFRKAVELSPGMATARFHLGVVLLRLGDDVGGKVQLEAFLATKPPAGAAEQAETLIRDPRRAREPIAPEYELTTLDGAEYSHESLRGKVVLFDFWATWCAPCLAALPDLKRLEARMEGKPFVMLSVSVDRKREVLETFLEKEGMDWPNAWDGGHEIAALFGVDSYPTYVLVDPDGRILYRDSGWGTQAERSLSAAVASAVKRAR